MSGSTKAIHAGSLNEKLLKKNTSLQQSVQAQLMIHQHLVNNNAKLEKSGRDRQQVTGYQIDSVVTQKQNNLYTMT